MEYTFRQLSGMAKSYRERYPAGTRIKLISMGNDPNPIPDGMKGTVEYIDDIATVFCRFDNGRRLGLAYGEDHFRPLTQHELLEEKCARNYDKYAEAVYRDIFPRVNLDRLANECANADDTYTTEILRELHDKFVEIYDTDTVDGLAGFVQVPAIIESLQTGDYYPGVVTLDMSSSGEHWGSCVVTPEGISQDGASDEDEAERMERITPYRYWYTVNCESDIHVDMADCPDDIRDIISSATGQSFEQNGGLCL